MLTPSFRFTADEISDLASVLCIPNPVITRTCTHFDPIEALGLLLARYRTPAEIFFLSVLYNHSQSSISELVNELSEFLDEQWKHLLEAGDHNTVISRARLAEYAHAISSAGSPLSTVWGFTDCTIRFICHPSWWQRQAFNGYKSQHAIKFQAIKLPNGLIGILFGPVEGRHNDNHLLAESKLIEWCYENAFRPGADGNTSIGTRYFHLFGDPAYGISPVLMSPFSGLGERTEEAKEWNEATSAVRIEVKHGFAEVTCSWPFLNAWWIHRVYSSPVGRYYRVGVLLANALNCIR